MGPIFATWITMDMKEGSAHPSGKAATNKGSSTQTPLMDIQAPMPKAIDKRSTNGTRRWLEDSTIFAMSVSHLLITFFSCCVERNDSTVLKSKRN